MAKFVKIANCFVNRDYISMVEIRQTNHRWTAVISIGFDKKVFDSFDSQSKAMEWASQLLDGSNITMTTLTTPVEETPPEVAMREEVAPRTPTPPGPPTPPPSPTNNVPAPKIVVPKKIDLKKKKFVVLDKAKGTLVRSPKMNNLAIVDNKIKFGGTRIPVKK